MNENNQIKNIDFYLGYWLRFVSNQVTHSFQQKLATKGVGIAEWLVLRVLWSKAPCSSTQLCDELSIDKGMISRISDKLEKAHLITRMVDKNDRRLYSIQLTAAGKALIPELVSIADENDAFFFGHLSNKESEHMMHFLKDMVQRFNLNQKPLN